MVDPTTNGNASGNVAARRAPRVALLGATLGTGNLGVDALGAATVQALIALNPSVEILYQSWRNEPVDVRFGARVHRCEPLVVRRKPNLRRQDGVAQLRRLATLQKRIGPRLARRLANVSQPWRRLIGCDAVLDISAGDSFADIYGEEVFWYQSQLKLLCLDLGLPLVLLPQTVGPFAGEAAQGVAADILSRSTLVCTRETAGVEEIHRVCGGSRPVNIAQSPDVAFLLDPSKTPLPEAAEAHLRSGAGPLIAVNVSGLLYFARRSFALVADHAELSLRLVRWALSQPGARVLLTPHVVAPPSSQQGPSAAPTSDSTDTRACEDLLERLTDGERQRVDLLRGADDPAKAKHAMARCDFFVGARMHAFIGSASQATPGALLAYSKKAEGTTGLVGVGDAVVDLRSLDADAVVAAVDRLYGRREELRERLGTNVPAVKDRVMRFFHEELGPAIGCPASEASPTEANSQDPHDGRAAVSV